MTKLLGGGHVIIHASQGGHAESREFRRLGRTGHGDALIAVLIEILCSCSTTRYVEGW